MAIAVDVSSNSGIKAAIAADWTWSHTCTGSNLVLYVAVVARDATNINNRTVSGVTYNGVALTSIDSRDRATGTIQTSLWRLIAPATGAHTISVAMTAYNTNIAYGMATSFTGVNQTTPEDTAANGSAPASAGTSVGSSTPVTLVTANAWIIGVLGIIGASGAITQVGDIGTQTNAEGGNNQFSGGSLVISDSLAYNGPGSAASHYVSWSWVNSAGHVETKVGIRPAAAATADRRVIMVS